MRRVHELTVTRGKELHSCGAGNDPHDAGVAWGVPAFPGDESCWLPSLPPPPVTPCAAVAAPEQPTAPSVSEKVSRHGATVLEKPEGHEQSLGSDSLIPPSHLTSAIVVLTEDTLQTVQMTQPHKGPWTEGGNGPFF